MQDTSGDVITRAAVGLALGTIAAFSLFIWSSAAWSDTATSVALQALIGFLTIAATSWMYTYYRTTGLVSHAILLSLLISLSVIHIGGAIPLLYVTIPTIIKTAPDKVSDILEVTIIAIAFVLASTRRHQESKRRLSPWIVALLAVIILAFYGGLYFFIFLNLSEPMLVLLAYAIGIVTILLLAYSIAFFSRMPFSFGTTDAALFLVSNGLFILSIIPLLLSMISSTLVWALSLTLQGLGMLLIILVLSISSQREMGMTERAALSFPIVNSLLAIVPFLVAILAQVALPAVLIVDVPAYRLSHIGAAALSGVMTFLIYAHFKRKPRRVHFPLVLVFACWTLIEIFIVASLDPETLIATGESLVPYIIGSLASSIGLLRAVEWAKEPKEGHAPHGIEKWVIWRFAVVAAVVILGAHLEGFLVLEFAMLEGSPLGRAILLCTNLAAMFIVIHLTYMLAKEQGSWSTLEGYSVGFLSLWIAPHILKGIYSDFQFGWWASEFILLVGLLLGPLALGALYLRELTVADFSQRRATLFSDVLVHDISNLHQAIVVSLGLLEVDEANVDIQEMALEDARISLQRAHQLIRNVRHLGQVDQKKGISFQPVDLVATIHRAIKQIEIENPDENFRVIFDSKEGECFVAGDELLNDLWYNLLRNSLIYSPNEKRIVIEIHEGHLDGKRYWETAITDHGQGIPPEVKATLFKRFMAGAKGTGLGLSVVYALTQVYSGRILVLDRVSGDYRKGTIIKVMLPTAEQPTMDVT